MRQKIEERLYDGWKLLYSGLESPNIWHFFIFLNFNLIQIGTILNTTSGDVIVYNIFSKMHDRKIFTIDSFNSIRDFFPTNSSLPKTTNPILLN
jgi:hypothetical protein